MSRNVAFAFVALVLVTGACQRNTVPPAVAAETFLKDLAIEYEGRPNCAGVDTDNDGYVTCTVKLKKPDPSGKMLLSLQCADITSDIAKGCDGHTDKYATGCKETVLMPTVPVSK